jgi:hypothetical protein
MNPKSVRLTTGLSTGLDHEDGEQDVADATRPTYWHLEFGLIG